MITLDLLISEDDEIDPRGAVLVFDLSFGDDLVESQHGVENEFALSIKRDYAVVDGQVCGDFDVDAFELYADHLHLETILQKFELRF